MIQIDLENLFSLKEYFQKKYEDKVIDTLKNIQKKRENLGFLDLDLHNDLEKIEKFSATKQKEFKNLIILWIWGSALWTRAILEAIKW